MAAVLELAKTLETTVWLDSSKLTDNPETEV
jgi:hypothetical protein